jgi:hypothetical protein
MVAFGLYSPSKGGFGQGGWKPRPFKTIGIEGKIPGSPDAVPKL